jgi:hypothetical protein
MLVICFVFSHVTRWVALRTLAVESLRRFSRRFAVGWHFREVTFLYSFREFRAFTVLHLRSIPAWCFTVWHLAAPAATESGGYLLRTKIRAAIEFFDQLYQYGEAGKTRITELGRESFEEDTTPELPELEPLDE